MNKVTFQLRPYQVDFERALSKSVTRHKRIIACAPTGSGKSKTFISIADKATSKGRAVIIISDAIKIHNQISGEAGGTEIANGVKFVRIESGKLYVAMAQTLIRRPLIIHQINEMNPAPLIIVDEAHVGTTSNIIKQLRPEIMILGFTATPDARVAKHLPKIYKDCVVCCTVDDLIQQGHLCSYTHYARSKSDLNLLEMRNGEFTEQSQNNAFNNAAVYDGIFEDLRNMTFTKCMIFVASIQHCEDMHERLTEAGYRSTRYHSKLDNASYELAKYTELDMADICVSVGSLTKGFDYPPTDMVILGRATTSLPLFLQMIGRASRPVPATGKDHFYVLDYGGNWERHGLYWDDRPWDKMWKQTKKKRATVGTFTTSMCDQCEAIIPAGTSKCPYCGSARPVQEKELEQGDLIEVTEAYRKLVGRQISTLNPQELSIYAKIKNKQRFAARVAKGLSQVQNGYLHEFAHHMGYKDGWVTMQLGLMQDKKIDFADIILR